MVEFHWQTGDDLAVNFLSVSLGKFIRDLPGLFFLYESPCVIDVRNFAFVDRLQVPFDHDHILAASQSRIGKLHVLKITENLFPQSHGLRNKLGPQFFQWHRIEFLQFIFIDQGFVKRKAITVIECIGDVFSDLGFLLFFDSFGV